MLATRLDQGLLKAALLERRSPRVRRPPRQADPNGPLLFLFRATRQVEREVEAAVLATIDPVLAEVPEDERVLGRSDQRTIFAAVGEDLSRKLEQLAVEFGSPEFVERARRLAREWGGRAFTQNRRAILRQIRSVLGVGLAGGDAAALAQVEMFVENATNLIVTIPKRLLDDVKGKILEAAVPGIRVEALRSEIMARFGVSQSRAALIARDQTLKLAGQLTKTRQEALGVRSYIWSTSKDERVRESHRRLEGTRHSWNEPPIVDEKRQRREHPGGDFQCRCVPIPDLTGLV